MQVYIYDIEVYSHDWFVTFRNPDSDVYIVIHNDNYHLREFLNQSDIVTGGFNNKHYDDWVLLTMIQGGSNYEVKKHNDFIIKEHNNGWEFPFVQFQKRPFKSFDLKDDIPDPGISLKSIEGNLKESIVECDVPFDIDRPLTPKEREKVIKYNKKDVDATILLYKARAEYLESKLIVGEMYNIPPAEALGLTNAKLCARVFDAKHTVRDDERNYIIPKNIDRELIPKKVMNFFMQIRDKSIPDTKLFGAGKGSKGMTLDVIFKTSAGECPVTYAWGGLHGAKPCVTVTVTKDRVILNFDVASLYPNSIINFGYSSRNIPDPKAYEKLVKLRLKYKKEGNKKKANALKLVINTFFGAMLNQYNDLCDRWAGRSICITNQLAMTMLIVMLSKVCETIDFININTDGIMFSIDRKEVDEAQSIVDLWSNTTGFEMERDDFQKVIQKDVNNYIGIKANGSMKTKGGYVSLYGGGDFKTNSLQIIHEAIVEYLVKGIDPEITIHNETDIFKFQQIVKTGGSYEGSYHYINGERVPIQKVNRIYAVRASKYGEIVKGKWITEKRRKDKITGKMISEKVDPPVWSESTIPECPKHAFVDNENILKINDLDKSYYIDMAKKRIDKYINIDRKVENKLKKIKEVITVMAEPKKDTFQPMNVYEKLIKARLEFLKANVKKTGINRFAEFKYYELADIVPPATKIFEDLGLVFITTFSETSAIGTLYNTENFEEYITFNSPIRELSVISATGKNKMNELQGLGAEQTYQRRYLYMMCLDIVEADTFDATSGEDSKEPAPKKSNKPSTPKEREEVKKELIDEGGEATEVQIKSIKNGLKKLRTKDSDKYESYVTEVVKKIKAGLNKTDAENLLIEIGSKIDE